MADDKRGGVRRLKPGDGGDTPDFSSDGDTTRFIRAQDFHSRYSRLITWELEDEMEQVEERLRHWSKQKLVEHGYTLIGVMARNSGWLFGDRVVKFSAQKGKNL
ncbi:MAG: hypothetical protein CXX81_13530, partial [Methanobacteriota archaeon]